MSVNHIYSRNLENTKKYEKEIKIIYNHVFQR